MLTAEPKQADALEVGYPISNLTINIQELNSGRDATMRKHFAMLVFVVLILGLCATSLFGQASGTVKGVVKDIQGNPIVDAVVLFANQNNGKKYPLRTKKKGEYFYLGVAPGKYLVTLYRTAEDAKANKELFHVNGFQVQLDENTLDFDMKKEQERTAQGQGLTPEQIKQMQEAKAKQEKEGNTVKALNEKLSAATTALQGGDYDSAISELNQANQMDPSRDLIWFKLGDAYRLSANKQTDVAEKQKRLDASVAAYQKAVQLKQSVTNDKDPDAAKKLAAYYNNLAEADAKDGKTEDAIKTYEQAAQTEPSAAGQYYFNEGAVLTNAGKADDAIAAFNKVIAADPNRADAYYWKGVNLIAKETMDKHTKIPPPPRTPHALHKYLNRP